ncbi:MAG: HupE/UreJ family protein [bacterium]|nr:HupE/UreJ family protein [bacterium]
MRTTKTIPALALLAATLLASGASAHEMRPGYLEIREVAESEPPTYNVLWKVPARGESARLGLYLRFADDVEIVREPVGAFVGGAHVQRMRIRREGGLDGTAVTIDGLEHTFTDVLLRLERADGTELTHRLTPEAPSVMIEAEPGLGSVAWTYFVLGVEHILGGIDHLLFVLALLLVVAGWRKLVVTVTAFTVAHSITLALATLGFVNVPGPPVEAVIALSIVFVAAEIVHGRHGGATFVSRRENPGLTARAPWIVAFTFGLLHGFGFAGALSDIGLPQTAIPLALLTFNVGVEAGQLLFIGALLVVWAAVRNIRLTLANWAWDLPPYAIGSVAAFWMIERVAGFW